MEAMPEAVARLIEAFSRLPGIGPKTASRLTFYLLKAPLEEVKELGEAVSELRERTVFCEICHHITDESPCAICRDERRDRRTICVVEDSLDVLAIERSGAYQGLYHVLHGAISPMEGIGPEDLHIESLVRRVEAGWIEEVILATNPSLEGEATAMYIRRRLGGYPVRVTRLARGLPIGGDLEYADAITLARALEGRQEVE